MGGATQSLIAELEARIGSFDRRDAYREPGRESVAGTWLGFIEQPGVALGGKTTAEVTLDASGAGSARDEWGTATLTKVDDPVAPVAFEKTYAERGDSFLYRGRIEGGVLLGTWESKRLPSFRGTFALANERALSVERRAAVRETIPAKSLRRTIYRVSLVAVGVALFGSRWILPRWLAAEMFAMVLVAALAVYWIGAFRSTTTMEKRVAALRRELGDVE